ncbi:MAG TPA: glycosyltransferase [Flavobacterium sp.]|nr:glycosyltransferase [Flavobacterium sp.]
MVAGEKIKLSVVILAKTDCLEFFDMTMVCIDSLVASEKDIPMEVIIVESNKNFYGSGFQYPDFVKIIIPETDFNFHGFLNIGISGSTGEFIALCNNDLVFHENWFGEMLKVSEKHPDILSFSPSGTPCPESEKGRFEIGYRVMQQLMGWCFVVKREIFKTIGPLDETFDFYYADNDYGMTLRYYNIRHALVCSSYVEHLERKSVPKITNASAAEKAFVKNYKIPDYLRHDYYKWVFESEKYLSGILKYHDKWGSPNWLHRKNKISDFLIRFHLGYFNRFFIKIRF